MSDQQFSRYVVQEVRDGVTFVISSVPCVETARAICFAEYAACAQKHTVRVHDKDTGVVVCENICLPDVGTKTYILAAEWLCEDGHSYDAACDMLDAALVGNTDLTTQKEHQNASDTRADAKGRYPEPQGGDSALGADSVDQDKTTWPDRTIDDVLAEEKEAIGDDWESTIRTSIINEHYGEIEKRVKSGGKITQDVFDSLEDGQKRDFMRKYGQDAIATDCEPESPEKADAAVSGGSDKNSPMYLPAGWTESAQGGLATNKDPVTGGIVDKVLLSDPEEWFVIPENDALVSQFKGKGFASRAEAFAALEKALEEWRAEEKKNPRKDPFFAPAKIPNGVRSVLKKMQVRLQIGEMPATFPEDVRRGGFLIMNAQRPVMADPEHLWDGKSVYGRFFAAILPDGEFAEQNTEDNWKMDARLLAYVPEEEVVAYFRRGKYAGKVDGVPQERLNEMFYQQLDGLRYPEFLKKFTGGDVEGLEG